MNIFRNRNTASGYKGGKEGCVKDLRYRLTASFIVFAVILMAVLWIFQAALLNMYYEFSMSRRCSSAIGAVRQFYAGKNDDLSYDSFMAFLEEKSVANDVYFLIESTDGSFSMSSADSPAGIKVMLGERNLIQQARTTLKSGKTSVKLSGGGKGKIGGNKSFICAEAVSPEGKNPVYIYAITSLTPLGPAVAIIRSQLLIVTAIAFVVGIFVARYTSKRLAKPITEMENKASELAKGNYDVHFEGGGYKELQDLAATLNQTAMDLKASEALQRDLIANVSHDLRTPLTMIKSYAEMIRDLSGDIPEKREAHLDVIINETDRLNDLVGDILMLSKMQSGVVEMERERFDIQKAGESVFSTYLVMENEGFKMNFVPVDKPVFVVGDLRKLQQAMSNLMSNAIRYSKDVKEVSMTFSVKDGRVICAVRDKGIGIAKEDLAKIWNRYQKASKQGIRSSQGTGLGLSIAAEIFERHGAEYGVESAVGKGSRFWFSLPIE